MALILKSPGQATELRLDALLSAPGTDVGLLSVKVGMGNRSHFTLSLESARLLRDALDQLLSMT